MQTAKAVPVTQVLKIASNVAFGILVVAALVFTAIVITYQPPDPWLDQPAAAATSKLFTAVQNATLNTTAPLLLTGEDDIKYENVTTPGSISNAEVEAAAQKALQEANTQSSVSASPCKDRDIVINCSDAGALAAIEKANLEKFPEIEFFGYKAPVRGQDEMSCDVAWKYKPKKESSRRMYRDYRRYTLFQEPSCAYGVSDVGDWHSGKNAIPLRFHGVSNGSTSSGDSNSNFRMGKYLYYTRSGDYCKGMQQYMWSFLCALGEAQYLNRTLVVDLDVCLSAKDNLPGRGDEPGKDLRLYIDLDHLKDSASIIEQQEFLSHWTKWDAHHNKKMPVRTIQDNVNTSPMQLKQEKKSIIKRDFSERGVGDDGGSEFDRYWYRVCEGESEKVITRPWNFIWKSKPLMNMVNTMCGKMEWDFDAVHLVGGEQREKEANVDIDIVETIMKVVKYEEQKQERYLYVAVRREIGYLRRKVMKESVTKSKKVVMMSLEDFEEVWKSENNGVEVDEYIRSALDSEMLLRAKKQFEVSV